MIKTFAIFIAIAAIFGMGWKAAEWRAGAAQVKTVVKAAKVQAKRAEAVQAIATENAKTQTEIRWRTKALIKEVPTYVTAETDRRYPLPVGMLRLYDATVAGVDVSAVPDPAGRPDDAPSDVKASDATSILVENETSCQADRARLAGLQAFVSTTNPPH